MNAVTEMTDANFEEGKRQGLETIEVDEATGKRIFENGTMAYEFPEVEERREKIAAELKAQEDEKRASNEMLLEKIERSPRWRGAREGGARATRRLRARASYPLGARRDDAVAHKRETTRRRTLATLVSAWATSRARAARAGEGEGTNEGDEDRRRGRRRERCRRTA